MINKAVEIACKAHSRQYDKAGEPYILHALHVMHQMPTEDGMVVAVLHDVLKNNEQYHPELLLEKGIPARQVRAVVILTRRPFEPYMAYLGRVRNYPVATKVKIADLRHNMDLTRLPEITEADRTRWTKYAKAVRYLEGVTNHGR